MKLPTQVTLRDVCPRDGFQSLPEFVPTPQKIEVIQALQAAGVSEIESTSFVSPKAIPQMRDAADLMAQVPRAGVTHATLVPNLKGAQNAIAAGADKLVVVISASEAHNRENVRRSVADSLADLDAIFDLARDRQVPVIGSVAVAFGCPYQGDVPQRDVFQIATSYLDRGAVTVILCDTTGMATPVRVAAMVREYQTAFPGTDFALHLHNNRGTAMANLLAALMNGATTFDTALGGIGGCPYVPQAAGNLPTEDVVYMLEDMGVRTGIDLTRIIQAAHLLERMLGYTLPGQVMKSGPRDPKLAAKVCGVSAH